LIWGNSPIAETPSTENAHNWLKNGSRYLLRLLILIEGIVMLLRTRRCISEMGDNKERMADGIGRFVASWAESARYCVNPLPIRGKAEGSCCTGKQFKSRKCRSIPYQKLWLEKMREGDRREADCAFRCRLYTSSRRIWS